MTGDALDLLNGCTLLMKHAYKRIMKRALWVMCLIAPIHWLYLVIN